MPISESACGLRNSMHHPGNAGLMAVTCTSFSLSGDDFAINLRNDIGRPIRPVGNCYAQPIGRGQSPIGIAKVNQCTCDGDTTTLWKCGEYPRYGAKPSELEFHGGLVSHE